MEIKCKYKFQDKEKFNGEEYCTCHNEVCKNLSFACPDNCQIYEDYKELQNKKEELDYLASFFDKSEVDIVNRLICYNRAVNAIRDIAASARADAGITDDYFKRNNYSQKQEQLKTLIQDFDKILKFCEVEKCN